MHNTRLQVFFLVLSHNAFMNAFDRFDQQCSFDLIIRCLKRVSKTLLTIALVTLLQNVFPVAQNIKPSDVCFAEFRRTVAN